MIIRHGSYILGVLVLVSCNNTKTQRPSADTTNMTVKLIDSSRTKLVSTVDSIVTSNSSPDDITISAKFINQGKYSNDDSYITVKTKNDSLIVLTNPMPLNETDITKLKKDGDNITLTYRASDRTVKFLAADYEPEK